MNAFGLSGGANLGAEQAGMVGDHLPTHYPDLRGIQIPPVCWQVGLRDFSPAGQMIERARRQRRNP